MNGLVSAVQLNLQLNVKRWRRKNRRSIPVTMATRGNCMNDDPLFESVIILRLGGLSSTGHWLNHRRVAFWSVLDIDSTEHLFTRHRPDFNPEYVLFEQGFFLFLWLYRLSNFPLRYRWCYSLHTLVRTTALSVSRSNISILSGLLTATSTSQRPPPRCEHWKVTVIMLVVMFLFLVVIV